MNETAFWLGYTDRLRGISAADCPYPEGSADAVEWARGWADKTIDESFGSSDASISE